MSLILGQIKNMDVTTDEFFEVYKAVNEKYWDFKDPDDEQTARKILHLINERGRVHEVILLKEIYQHLMKISDGGTVAFEIGFSENRTFFVKLSTDPDGFDNLKKMLENTVVVKSREETK